MKAEEKVRTNKLALEVRVLVAKELVVEFDQRGASFPLVEVLKRCLSFPQRRSSSSRRRRSVVAARPRLEDARAGRGPDVLVCPPRGVSLGWNRVRMTLLRLALEEGERGRGLGLVGVDATVGLRDEWGESRRHWLVPWSWHGKKRYGSNDRWVLLGLGLGLGVDKRGRGRSAGCDRRRAGLVLPLLTCSHQVSLYKG